MGTVSPRALRSVEERGAPLRVALPVMELLEREGELQQLRDAWERARDGAGSVALVRGEAGIGKTALTRRFVSEVGADAHVLWGGCDDLFTPAPLGPLWDMAHDDAALLDALQRGERIGVFRAVVDLLARRLRPTVVVIEDTHWADEATLDVIRYVGRRMPDAHGVLLLTYRDEDAPTEGGLRAVLGDLPSDTVERIRLGPLSPEAVSHLAAERDMTDDPSLALAGGNPLLVTELLADPTRPVPASIQSVYLARLARLTPEARMVAGLVSVVPSQMERWLLAEAMGEAAVPLAECEQRRVLEISGDEVRFRHELARLAAETSLTEEERRHNNQVVVDALAAGKGAAPRILHHAHAAGDNDAIVRFGPQAALAAAEAGNHREAMAHHLLLEPLLHRLEPSLRAELLEARISEESHSGTLAAIPHLGKEAIDLYRSVHNPAGVASVLTKVALCERRLGHKDLAEAAIVEAVDLLSDPSGQPGLALAYSFYAVMVSFDRDFARADELADRAIALATEEADLLARSHALRVKASTLMRTDFPGTLALLEKSIKAGEEGGSPETAFDAVLFAGIVAHMYRNDRTAERKIEEAMLMARDLGSTNAEAAALTARAWLRVDQGRWTEAEEDAETALEILIANRHPFIDEPLMALARILARRGSPWEPTLEKGIEAASTLGPEVQAEKWRIVAEAYWLAGRSLEDEAAAIAAIDVVAEVWPWDASELGFWLWKHGVLSGPLELSVDPHRLQIEGQWNEAARMWDELGDPYMRAIALADGDTDAKLEGLRIFDGLDARPMASRLRSDLRRAGVQGVPRGPRVQTRRHPAGLTRRQAEVLGLMAKGLSNIQIAEELFVSPRTAEHHVSAVIRKLDASDRTRAVERARELGALDDRPGV